MTQDPKRPFDPWGQYYEASDEARREARTWTIIQRILLVALIALGIEMAWVAANLTLDAVQRQTEAGAVEW